MIQKTLLLASTAILTAVPVAAHAQTLDTTPQAISGELGEEIIVTGTRAARPDLSSPSPVTLLGNEQIQNASETNISRIINDLPIVSPARGPTNGGDFAGSFVDLRGLGRQRTLTLVNGRRFVNTISDGGVDLANVPGELIERIEIVTGGASATYGSDAVAGVVNILLRDDIEGLELNTQYGVTDRGEGTNLRAAATMGGKFADNRGYVWLHASYDKTYPIVAGGRSYVDPIRVNAGNGTFESLLSARVASGSAATPGDVIAFFQNGELFAPNGTANLLPRSGFFNEALFARLQQPSNRTTIMAGGTYDISDGLEFYTELLYVKNNIFNRRSPRQLGLGGQLISVANPFIGAQTRAYFQSLDTDSDGFVNVPSLGRRFTELGERRANNRRESYRILGGLKYSFAETWTLDANVNYSRSDFTLSYDNEIDFNRLGQALDAVQTPSGVRCRVTLGNCVPVNIFGLNTITPEAAQFISARPFVNGTNTDLVIQAIISGSFANPLGALPIGIATGFEFKDSTANELPSADFAGLGTTSAGGLALLDGKLKSTEIFAEATVPLVSEQPFARYLGVEVGARYSKFSPGASAWTFKALLEWAPIDELRFRGGWQKSVRAPNIFELAAGDVDPEALLSVDPCFTGAPLTGGLRAACLATGLPTAVANSGASGSNFLYISQFFGNPGLAPEKARSLTAGVIISDVVPRFSLTADFYDILIKGSIGTAGVDRVIAGCYASGSSAIDPFCNDIERDPITGEVVSIFDGFRNLGSEARRGIDLSASYNLPVGSLFAEPASLTFSSGATYLLKARSVTFAGEPDSATRCDGRFGPGCGVPLPKWKMSTRLGYGSDAMRVSLAWNWIGNSTDTDVATGAVDASTLGRPRIGNFHYFDLATNFRVGEQLQLRFGVDNLFDKTPPVVGSDRVQGPLEASSYYALYDQIGRRFFAGATVKF